MDNEVKQPLIYSMPHNFMLDQKVPARWRLLGLINGFVINGLQFYATNEWIMKELNCSEHTVSSAISELEKLKEIKVTRKGLNRVIERVAVSCYKGSSQLLPKVATGFHKGSNQLLHNSDNIIQIINSDNINNIAPNESVRSIPKKRIKKTQAEKEAEAMEPIDMNEKIKTMLQDKDRRIRIIAWYWKLKRFNLKTKGAYATAIRRELRPAGDLLGYTTDEIKAASKYCDREYSNIKWTLETIAKVINEAKSKVGEGETLVF